MAESKDKPPSGYRVLLCVSGGIAAYKSADLASKLVQGGAGVTVAMTEGGQKFVTPLTFQAITHKKVYTSLWLEADDFDSQHLSLTESADLMIIAPATADIIAKMAAGIADDLVSTLALSAHDACDILIAPAMNTRMWDAPATVANVATLKDRGVHTVGPGKGYLVCGMTGRGRMAETADILAAATELLKANPPKTVA